MAGLFDTEYHERKIEEYQPPLSKLNKVDMLTILDIDKILQISELS